MTVNSILQSVDCHNAFIVYITMFYHIDYSAGLK